MYLYHFEICICVIDLLFGVTNSYLASSAARLWNDIQICNQENCKYCRYKYKMQIWVWNARLENLPIFAESLEQPAHISQLRNTEIQKYLYIWIYTMAYDIFIVSVCLHLKKWIWEEILSRESGGKWNLKQNGGTKQNLYKNGTNITYLLPLPFKIKSNCNLQISSNHRRCSAHVWHNMCNTSS